MSHAGSGADDPRVGPTTEIRAAVPSDAPVLAAMIEELAVHEGTSGELRFTVDQLRAALSGKNPRLHALLAVDDGQVRGAVTYTIDFAIWTGGEIIRVDDVFVRASSRSAGVGRRLMEAVAVNCVGRGVPARWEVEPENRRARRFYERLGVEIREKLVARWNDAAMRRLLGLTTEDESPPS
jgi:GNAT superfamily N-acetyltransferase